MGIFGGDSSSTTNTTTITPSSANNLVNSGNAPVVNIAPVNVGGNSIGGAGGAGGLSALERATALLNASGDGYFGPSVNELQIAAAATAPAGGAPVPVAPSGSVWSGRDSIVTNISTTDHNAVLAGRDLGLGALESNTLVTTAALTANQNVSLGAIQANSDIAAAGLALANNVQTNAFGFAGAIGGQAISANTALSGASIDAVMAGQSAALASAERMAALQLASLDSTLAGYQRFAEQADRSEESLNTDTLIKWGAGAFIVIFIAVFWNKK